MDKVTKIERERGWLLRNTSIAKTDKVCIMWQFYHPDGTRYRYEIWLDEYQINAMTNAPSNISITIFNHWLKSKSELGIHMGGKWVGCIKNPISVGTNDETEWEISTGLLPAPEQLVECTKAICKVRYIYIVGDKKWEVDMFGDMKLVKMELEIPESDPIDAELDIPDHLKELIIMEVTHIPGFSNRSLAAPYSYPK